MKAIIKIIKKKLIRLEHIIYCFTNCRIELPLHKTYYAFRRKVYEDYLTGILPPSKSLTLYGSLQKYAS